MLSKYFPTSSMLLGHLWAETERLRQFSHQRRIDIFPCFREFCFPAIWDVNRKLRMLWRIFQAFPFASGSQIFWHHCKCAGPFIVTFLWAFLTKERPIMKRRTIVLSYCDEDAERLWDLPVVSVASCYRQVTGSMVVSALKFVRHTSRFQRRF